MAKKRKTFEEVETLEALVGRVDDKAADDVIELSTEESAIAETALDSDSAVVELAEAEVSDEFNAELVAASTEETELATLAEDVEKQESDSNAATQLVTDRSEIKRAVEAIIFASPKAVSARRIKGLLTSNNFDVQGLDEVLEEIEKDYADRGFNLKRVANSWQFRTNPSQADILQNLLEDRPVRLSPSALEVLAIVAYKQPVTRAEVDAVRGIDSSHLTRGLMEKNLIRSEGHAETPGRPILFGTTPYFLEVFGLDSLDDLPSAEEFEKELAVTGDADGEGTVLVGDADELLSGADFHDRSSGLPANPDRGSYDETSEESVHAADFGVAERALTEAEA